MKRSGHDACIVIPARLERATHSLEGCCSIQLSYRAIVLIIYKKMNCKTRKKLLIT